MAAGGSKHCRRVAFVVGAPRSGTTLLTHMLHRHPEVSATPETHFLCHAHSYRGGARGVLAEWPVSGKWLCSRMAQLETPGWRAAWPRTFRGVGDGVSRRLVTGLRRLFLAVIEDAAVDREAPLLVEKTPQHIEYLPLLRRLFPRAPIIHIVRDGRAVVSSLARMPWWHRGATGAAAYWAEWVPRASSWVRRDANAIEVRYEELVRDPEAVLAQVTQCLGIPYTPAMLEPLPGEELLVERRGGHKAGAMRPIEPAHAEAWKERLDERELRYVETLLAESLAALGYYRLGSPRRRPLLVVGGADGDARAWKAADPLIREEVEKLRPGQVWVRRLSRERVPAVRAVSCEDFARSVLEAPSRAAAARAAWTILYNVSRLGRSLAWVRPTVEARWRRRAMIEEWIANRVRVVGVGLTRWRRTAESHGL